VEPPVAAEPEPMATQTVEIKLPDPKRKRR